MAVVVFADRADAGRRLAERLGHLRGVPVVVLGLPRGGVPVAAAVADALGAPLDVVVVRKLGTPGQPELAMGAIGESGASVLDEDVIRATGVDDATVRAVAASERVVLEARAADLRSRHPRLDLHGRTVVLVDDGVATGSTARAACQVVRALGAVRVVLATPVAPRDVARSVPDADEIVCVASPRQFAAVGLHYRDFSPTTDEEVERLLARSRPGSPPT